MQEALELSINIDRVIACWWDCPCPVACPTLPPRFAWALPLCSAGIDAEISAAHDSIHCRHTTAFPAPTEVKLKRQRLVGADKSAKQNVGHALVAFHILPDINVKIGVDDGGAISRWVASAILAFVRLWASVAINTLDLSSGIITTGFGRSLR